jgi:RHS repeat-associated protein
LRQEVRVLGGTPTNTEYTYDAVGNRKQKLINTNVVEQYAYNARHELTGITDGAGVGLWGFEYDVNGNTTRKKRYGTGAVASRSVGSRSASDPEPPVAEECVYDWDELNRLRRAGRSDGVTTAVATFEYAGGMGWQVASQTVTSSSGSEQRQFAWGYGGELLSERITDAGSQIPDVTRTYVNGGVDQVLWSVDGASANFWLNDVNGSVYGITDQTGSIIQRQRYDAYGATEVTQENAGFANRVGFQGRNEVAGLGLQYFRNRFYDPQIGRFLSRDPLGLIDGPAVYAFCGGDPVNRTDPMGTTVQFHQGGTLSVDAIPGGMSALEHQLAADMVNSPQTFTFRNSIAFMRELNGRYGYWRSRVDNAQQKATANFAGFDWAVVGRSAAEQAGETWEGAAVIAEGDAGVAYNEVVNQQAAAAAIVMQEDGEFTAAAYVVGNFVGTTPLMEGVTGYDTASRQELDEVDRWSRGLQGAGGTVLSVTGAASTANSLRAGYAGTGFKEFGRWATTYRGSGLSRVNRALRAQPRSGQIGRERLVSDSNLDAAGKWDPGSPDIKLSRPNIRGKAINSGRTNIQELRITVYHEAFHRGFFAVDEFVSKVLGVDDIYGASKVAFERGTGSGAWYRMEEWLAERYGELRMGVRGK